MSGGGPIPGLVEPSAIRRDTEVECDVAVIGSGAGGSIAAWRLASAGAKVAVFEEGGYHWRRDFRMQEEWSYPHLYQDQGSRATDDRSIQVLQGRCVGGGTTVNWTTSFRTPVSTLEHWRREHAVEGVTADRLAPHWDDIETRLSVQRVGHDEINPNNSVLLRGATALGYGVELLRRNTRNCMQTGMCGLGCPVDAKQSAALTYLPDAAAAGATIYSGCRVTGLRTTGGAVIEALADVLSEATNRPAGPRLRIRALTFIVSGGAINTPRLLLRSGVPDPHRRIGRRTWIHPTVASAARFADRIEAYFGVPQSVGCHQFATRPGRIGYFIETPPIQPMLAGMAVTGFGAPHRSILKDLPRVNALIGLAIDGFLPQEEGGIVAERAGGRLSFRYSIGTALAEAMREAMKTMARIQLAAGALEVSTFHEPPVRIRTERDIARIDELGVGWNRCAVFTAHQMGGASMGEDPTRAVVDSRLKHHRLSNLYVMDGSVFPTSLGVNPQISILGVSSLAASALAAR
jgi:choline dehydrogenase-like flavoprotein